MGKDHHVDERRPTTDMVCRMRKVGAYHYRSLCLSPDRARNMLERKACICFFPSAVPRGGSEMLAVF